MVAVPALTLRQGAGRPRADRQPPDRQARNQSRTRMGKLVVSLDGVVIKEVQITKDKTTLGRRPLQRHRDRQPRGQRRARRVADGGLRRLHRRPEQHQRHLHQRQGHQEAACWRTTTRWRSASTRSSTWSTRRRLREDHDHAPGCGRRRHARRPAAAAFAQPDGAMPSGNSGFGGQLARRHVAAPASIKVLNGAAAGREVVADQGGHHGRQARRAGGLDHQAAGRLCARPCRGQLSGPAINGVPLTGPTRARCRNGDVIELAGTQMQFIQA